MKKSTAIAACFTLMGVAHCTADKFRAVITKVDGNKVTFPKVSRGGKGKQGEKGEAMTMSAAANVKLVKGKFNPAFPCEAPSSTTSLSRSLWRCFGPSDTRSEPPKLASVCR